LSKYSKYAEGLLINMSRFYIHRGLPCWARCVGYGTLGIPEHRALQFSD
jgi:hypothetical protein